jgi:hypothetical protein
MCNVPPGKKGGLREVRVLARCAPVDCDRARGGDFAGGLRPAADIRANFGDPRLVPLRLHGAMHRREAGHQGGARMSQAQCRQSIAVVQGGARRRWTAADRERRASACTGEACTSGCSTAAASASRRGATSTSGNRRAARRRGGAGCSSRAGPAAVEGKKPPSPRVAAVRAACRSDFGVHCPGVKPGSSAALRCLQANAAALSPPSRNAVMATGEGGAPPPAVGAAPPPTLAPLGPIPPMRPRKALEVLSFCGAEQRTLCGNVPPGGGRIIECLAANYARLSPECYGALARAAR